MESLRIARFGGSIAPTKRQFADLKALIEQCDNLYPGISAWYRRKVVSGFNEQERTAYVLYSGDTPVGATVLKLGSDAKICSLRILPDAERNGLGKLLMALLARDLRNSSRHVHFTIPQTIWAEKAEFFGQYGFKDAGRANEQYRLFDQEFFCRGSFASMWKRVVDTLPSLLKNVSINGYTSRYDLIMSMRPAYAGALLRGNKTVEIRRKFSSKWVGAHTLIYSSQPESSFVGSFRISNVVEGSPKDIWCNFRPEIGCDQDEYDQYTKGADKVYAIITDDRFAFKNRIPSIQVSHLLKRDFTAPQSYSAVRDGSALEEIGSISALLQATL